MLNDVAMNVLWMCVVINAFLSIASFTLVVKRFNAPLYHPVVIFLLYHFLGFVCRPAIVAYTNWSNIWARTRVIPEAADIIVTSIIANIALMCVLVAFVIATRGSEVRRFATAEVLVSRPQRFILAASSMLLLGLWGTYQSYGGAGLQTVQAFSVAVDQQGGQRLVGVSGYATALAEFIPALCIILFLIPRYRRLSLVLLGLFVCLRLYIGAQRLSFVAVVLAVALLVLVNNRQRYPRLRTWIGLGVLAILFDLLGGDRFAFRRLFYGTASIGEVVAAYREKRGAGGFISDIVEFDVAASVAKLVPDVTGWSYGSQYLRLLVWPIPRQLWPNKPVFTSLVNLNEHGYFFGLTHTLYMDAYMIYGAISLALVMFAVGYFFTRIYEVATGTSSVVAFMLFWTVVMYSKTLLRDGGVTVFYFIGLSMLAVVVSVRAGGLKLCRRP